MRTTQIKFKSPLPRYMGSKRKFCKLLDNGKNHQVILEPFAGAAHYSFHKFSQPEPPSHVFWGEKDASVRAIFLAWGWGYHEEVCAKIHDWKERFRDNGARTMWPALTDAWETCNTSEGRVHLIDFAAASLVLRKLTFGGMLRTNKSDGRLNIKYVGCQLPELLKWNFTFPPIPEDAPFCLMPSWQGCIMQFRKAERFNTAEALLDPPYWSPDKSLTGCYPGHDPSSVETFGLSVDSFRACLEDERIKRIILCNYYSDELDCAVHNVAGEFGEEVQAIQTGTLAGVQKSRKITTTESQAIWVVERR
jgi:hypothetical protein